MSERLTPEQSAAIAARGKVIVSASAGSGKTFVMIRKIADLITEEEGDLDEILAVTFTKKAAAQMKEKLRSALIERLPALDEKKRRHVKTQLGKIPSADISTIHSFCSHLVRTYFYALGIDSSFDIIADDDAVALTLKNRAMENLFDKLYEEEDADFKILLSALRKNRSDDNIKFNLLNSYKKVRMIAGYGELLSSMQDIYSDEGFEKICREYKQIINGNCLQLMDAADRFASSFTVSEGAERYAKIFDEMRQSLSAIIAEDDLYALTPGLNLTSKPKVTPETARASEEYSAFRKEFKEKYDNLFKYVTDRETDKNIFIKSGALAAAFARVLLKFDGEYARVKSEEGKLDYDDLEHFTLRLLSNEDIKNQINAKYKHVFVDEYQDVNPVQERIISEAGAHSVFTVGDVKQAIYGFRGSKSLFFAQKYNRMLGGDGEALKLTNNFRSADGVLSFVNALFSQAMVSRVCGFDYKNGSEMSGGGGYPEGCGKAEIHVFGKDKAEKEAADGIYSVAEHSAVKSGHTREGLAVLEIVRRELSGKHYDLKSRDYVDTQPGDICILTRKNYDRSAAGIIKALTDAGYSVAGAKQSNVCDRAEVRQLLDVLSYIDNSQQDIPLAATLLSPLGGFTEDELAAIRIAQTRKGERLTFRECAVGYAATRSDALAYKLADFFRRIYSYRRLSEIVGAAKLIDKILSDSGLSARYAAGNGEKLEGIRRLASEAYTPTGELSLNAFLAKIKAGGGKITAPSPSSSDSIKIMTMHASKGLEFPVVIIADVAASFGGRDLNEMPFDEEYGFFPAYYDAESRIQRKTLLSRLCKLRLSREEIKNELNLFYVACTRAMCNLHVMASELKPYDGLSVLSADCYADLCDFSPFTPEYMPTIADFDAEERRQIIITEPDPALYGEISSRFMREYPHGESVDLPVKSSASQLLKNNFEESYFAENQMFPEDEEGDTADNATTDNSIKTADTADKINNAPFNSLSDKATTDNSNNTTDNATPDNMPSESVRAPANERGTAYHRFLELCDFSVKDRAGIVKEIEDFIRDGLMPPAQAELLSADNLAEILAMSVFRGLEGATLYREREFLCRLPANSFLPTSADDGVLFQGAIDLLATGKDGTAIIDYKYSSRSDEELVAKYSAQLALYKKAVATILKINEDTISTTIINIRLRREIRLT